MSRRIEAAPGIWLTVYAAGGGALRAQVYANDVPGLRAADLRNIARACEEAATDIDAAEHPRDERMSVTGE